ncbi:flagellar hook-associated protein FlgK [Paludicola sp. MB14-C6]|uniref:flagellar hook-associated protein FlgK n=1 Tax=Paludihabitans sp. MB14-C6 TaxID=3070656 RepID=UPI0027DADC97|nr:flagellar hook-associated protein FlgK [Paludicola sp. MB14-C6]WMJ24257.1 flagellar hook-associated protein FlgK [Paludicola sp. MB14-C6]
MRPTFAGFYVAKRGLDAARANLSVTGQNITNVKTAGYTRQRVDLYSVGASGYNMRYATKEDSNIGEGVSIGGIIQVRDPYLDLRYRREHSKVGESGIQLDALSDLEYIFDEITKDGLDKQFSDLKSQLQNLSLNPNDPVSEGIVKTSALMLVKMFNHCSEQINTVKQEQLATLQDGSITRVNELLRGIANLNGEIKNANVSGNQALELMDQRNTMIDELSGYVNLEITSKTVDIGGGRSVEEMSINLIGAGGDKFNLVDDNKNRSFGVEIDSNGIEPVKITLNDFDGSKVTSSNKALISIPNGDISGQLTTGAFAGHLSIINSKGEFDTPPTKDRGIQYYENMLNTLANQFATAFNKANSMNISEPWDKPMFEAKDGKPITAGNLAISSKWENAIGSYITSTKQPPKPGVDKPADNILNMISLFSSDLTYTTTNGNVPLFKGTFQGCFSNINSTLALEIKDITRMNDSSGSVLEEIDNQRASISAVNIDDEGINLIQYNQALSASSRFMTTLDEALDTIIKGMGVVGR